jgi:ribosome assembly protein YihI (activator of Der GTPase)
MIRKGREGMGVRTDEFQNEESLLPEQRVYFDRCMDFLARMMEKYGDEIELPLPKTGTAAQTDDTRSDAA